MGNIERNVYVLMDMNELQPPIEYVQSTNMLPIIFHFLDYDIPSGSSVRVYVNKPSGRAVYDNISSISGNNITIDVKDTMFDEVGRSLIQIAIKKAEKTLVTFAYPVDVRRNNVAGEAPASGNSSNFLDEYLKKIDDRMDDAEQLADDALTAADTAAKAAAQASSSANDAADSAELANDFSAEAESFAHGGTGTRVNEATDNAKYYYEQSKRISQGLSGIIPMGTIAFAELPDEPIAGYMYNISDAFTTTERFKEGVGHPVPAGTNVYYTADGYWDCMAGAYLPLDGDSKDNTATFTSGDSTSPTGWTDVDVVKSGEKHSSLLAKISTMIKNVRWLYKMFGTTDISALGGGTVTGAISALNAALARKQASVTGGASTITSSNLTANRALVSNSSGKVAVSAVTSTELSYLDGVTSNIQTQLNAKASTASCAGSDNGVWRVIQTPSGDKWITGTLDAATYNLTGQYGALYYAPFSFTLPSTISYNGIRSCVITVWSPGGTGLCSATVTALSGRTISGFIANGMSASLPLRLSVLIGAY